MAKNGPLFEKQVVAKNLDIPNPNLKYSFLVSSNPYHAYYQHRVSEFLAQPPESSEQSAPVADVEAGSPKTDSATHFTPECKVPEPPEPEEFTVRLPQGISGEELDVIKLTAQFVAGNGKSFLTGLKSREMHSPQFNFLKPNHSMFTFFTSLTDAYSKVLMSRRIDREAAEERCRHDHCARTVCASAGRGALSRAGKAEGRR